MENRICRQVTFTLIIIALVLLITFGSMAGEKQGNSFDTKGIQVSTIAIDPVNTNIIYIGTQTGVFKSTDAGSNWVSDSKGLKNTEVLTLVIDPLNPQTLYAGTRCGAFKSTDGDRNWIVSK